MKNEDLVKMIVQIVEVIKEKDNKHDLSESKNIIENNLDLLNDVEDSPTSQENSNDQILKQIEDKQHRIK